MNALLNNPLRFLPNLHPMIWGGDAIPAYKNISTDLTGVGESWEISAVPGKESVVSDGPMKGKKLSDLAVEFGPKLLGKRVFDRYGAKFPLLVKLIDARTDLSVQVHPDDDLALKRHGSLGKTEMWYIIDSRPGAKINVGFRSALDPAGYEKRVADSTIGEVIASYESRPGDTFFIPAGRVHAIGGGNLLAEIQESSDITYRIYDYGRRDSNGNLRELHTSQARDAIDYTVLDDYRSYPVKIDDMTDELVDCSHFSVDRMQIGHEQITIKGNPETFLALMCLDGECMIDTGSGPCRFSRGETVLIAASVNAVRLSGDATLLTITA